MNNRIDPLEVQFGLAHDCIRACIYGNYIAKSNIKKDAWLSILDMCYSDAIISWNAIFEANSQNSHWKKLVMKAPAPERSTLKPFCKTMIIEYLETTETEWDSYHAMMVDIRNNRLAHFNHLKDIAEPPNITWALHSAYLYREWLLSLLRAYQKSGLPIKISETTGKEMLTIFNSQIEEICK